MATQGISKLSISTLKSVLSTNHVNAGLILEKGELVAKVNELVEEERTRRERKRLEEMVEEWEIDESIKERQRKGDPVAPPAPRRPVERDGLCVVCYDNDANIAVVDCGSVFFSFPHFAHL